MQIDIDLSQFTKARDVNAHVQGLMGFDGWENRRLVEWVDMVTSLDAGDVAHLRSDAPERYVLALHNADTAKSTVLRAFIRIMKRVNRRSINATGHPILALSIE